MTVDVSAYEALDPIVLVFETSGDDLTLALIDYLKMVSNPAQADLVQAIANYTTAAAAYAGGMAQN